MGGKGKEATVATLNTEGLRSMVKATIVNVVATASLKEKIDLEELERFEEFRHDPQVYGGRVAYFKSQSMRGRVIIFSSGKMISVGTTSEKEAYRELELAQEFLAREGLVKPRVLQFETQNIVVVANLEQKLDLERLVKTPKIIYEPEQFPGAMVKIAEPYKATILIFASGKAVVTGLKSSSQIEAIVQELARITDNVIEDDRED